ncbi:MAG: hypothetical protein R3A48_10485 [Polyangiales bacterium]
MKRPSAHRLALALCALLTPGLASAQYLDLPGSQPGALDGGIPLESGRPCSVSCHFAGDTGPDVAMPADTWMGSMMGNTLRDPLFLAALTVAEQDRPGVGDWCLRCHTPAGFINGRTRGPADAPRGERLDLEDRDGVTCDACHRMLPTPNLGNAQYVLSPSDTRFGPYAEIDSPRHTGAVSTWLADSRMCGTCHEVSNPAQPQRGADGADTGRRFPLDTTFSEWSRSAWADPSGGRTCQDCHMPRVEGDAPVSTYVSALPRPTPRRHEFAGANAWALRVLGAMRGEISSGEFYDPDSAPFYEAGARRAEAMLRSAVSLELRSPPTEAAPGARVEVVVRVTNLAGHRVPTGYADGRRMWLEVSRVDAEGVATVLSGAYDDAQARLVDDPNLALYEAWHGRAGMGRGEHIALHDSVIRDTRLPPRGYRPLPGHEPVGADYAGGEAGALRHWDDRRYTVEIPATARGELTLRVRARYQSTTREYVEFLASENRTDDRGRELLRRYEASGRAAPFTMAEATTTLTLRVPAADAAVADVVAEDASVADVTGLDAGTSPPPPEGCGCRATTGSSGRLGSFLVLLALARRRRRGSAERTPRDW